jgi:hypothetical protein
MGGGGGGGHSWHWDMQRDSISCCPKVNDRRKMEIGMCGKIYISVEFRWKKESVRATANFVPGNLAEFVHVCDANVSPQLLMAFLSGWLCGISNAVGSDCGFFDLILCT